jgi:hypothetical protein
VHRGHAFAPLACAILAAACGTSGDDSMAAGSGSLHLVLSLPPTTSTGLRPSGMTNVAVTISEVGGESTVSTTPLVMGSDGTTTFATADIAVGSAAMLEVELIDDGDRLVGYGATSQAVTPSATESQTVTIAVRKPFVYVANDGAPRTLDPTIDASNSTAYQGSLAGGSAVAIVSVDGTEMSVLNATSLTRVGTSDHKVIGSPITIKEGGVADAAVIPGQRKVVAATAAGLDVIDLDAGTVVALAVGKSDRVAVGVDDTGTATLYALQGRVGPAIGSGACGTGSSTVLAMAIDGTSKTTVTSAAAIADISASADAVFGAEPCAGEVANLKSGSKLLTLTGAATVAVQNDKLWAAGSQPPTTDTSGNPQGARIVLASIGLDGTNLAQVTLPPKSELVTYDHDDGHELSINIHADTEIPVDLAVLPGGEYVALIGQMDSHRDSEYDESEDRTAIPTMDAEVYDVMLADPQTGSLAQRVRAKCTLTLMQPARPDVAEFPDWSCGDPPENETPTSSTFVPAAVAALYGAR